MQLLCNTEYFMHRHYILTWPFGTSFENSSETKDDGSLILFHYLQETKKAVVIHQVQAVKITQSLAMLLEGKVFCFSVQIGCHCCEIPCAIGLGFPHSGQTSDFHMPVLILNNLAQVLQLQQQQPSPGIVTDQGLLQPPCRYLSIINNRQGTEMQGYLDAHPYGDREGGQSQQEGDKNQEPSTQTNVSVCFLQGQKDRESGG